MGSCLQCQQYNDTQNSFVGSFSEYIEEQVNPQIKCNLEQVQQGLVVDSKETKLESQVPDDSNSPNQVLGRQLKLNRPAYQTLEINIPTPKKQNKKLFSIKNECIWDQMKTKRKSIYSSSPLSQRYRHSLKHAYSLSPTNYELGSIKYLELDEIKSNDNDNENKNESQQGIKVSLQSPNNENIIIFDYQIKEEINNNYDEDKPVITNAVNLNSSVIQIQNIYIVKLLQQLEPITESFLQDRLTLGPQLFLTSGNIYIGQWLKGKRDGFGKYIYTDGHYYEGNWKNDQQNGYGRMILQNGDYYFGEYLNGQQNGKGITVLKDGSSHEGYWKDNQKHGDCKEIAIDGSIFTGSYSKGYRDGQGRIDYQDGSIYIGEFKKGSIEGEGTQIWPDGRTYTGQWVEGKMHGKGKFVWAENKWYSGDYQDNMRSGYGEYHWPNGKIYEGQWKNGVMHGKGIIFDIDEKIKKGIWKKGVLQPSKNELKDTQKTKQKSKSSSKSVSQLQSGRQSRITLAPHQFLNS